MMKKIGFPLMFLGVLFLISNISYNNADDSILCHYKAKVVAVGSCLDDVGRECASEFKRFDTSSSDFGTIDGLVMKGQTVYQRCYNDGENQMCYTKLNKRLDKKYSNYCPTTERFNDFYKGKEENITLLGALINYVLK